MGKELTLFFHDGTSRKVEHVRPPRWVLWKHGRTASVFRHKVEEIASGEPGIDDEEKGARFLESMSEAEAVKFQAFADDVVRYSTKPQVKVDELTEKSYMTVFGRSFYTTPNAEVETEEGTTDKQTVETFPVDSALPANGENVPDVSPAAV